MFEGSCSLRCIYRQLFDSSIQNDAQRFIKIYKGI